MRKPVDWGARLWAWGRGKGECIRTGEVLYETRWPWAFTTYNRPLLLLSRTFSDWLLASGDTMTSEQQSKRNTWRPGRRQVRLGGTDSERNHR
eukprot:285528-Hanusia_phi.AAC.1